MKRASAPIAFQGERGAFSEEAARKLLGPRVEVLPCPRFEDLFLCLKDGRASGAVVPIENTLAGSVHENYDHLVNYEFPIVAETSVRIVHNLIALKGVKFSQIRRAFSHPVALNQCLDFFARNPQIERTPFYDTAGSIKMLAEEGLDGRGGNRLGGGGGDLRGAGAAAVDRKRPPEFHPLLSAADARVRAAPPVARFGSPPPGRPPWFSASATFPGRCFAH